MQRLTVYRVLHSACLETHFNINPQGIRGAFSTQVICQHSVALSQEKNTKILLTLFEFNIFNSETRLQGIPSKRKLV